MRVYYMKFQSHTISIFLLAILLSLQGCEIFVYDLFEERECTGKSTEIKGRFTTEDGLLPVKNLELALSWDAGCGMGCFWGNSNRFISTKQTDDNGNYSFKFCAFEHEVNGSSYFVVTFSPPDSFNVRYPYNVPYPQSFSIENIMKKDTVVIFNYHLPKKGFIELILKNPEDLAEGDRLVCQVFYEYGDRTHTEWGETLDSDETTSILSDAARNQTNYIRIFRRKGGQETVTIDTIYVQKQVTYEYEVRF